MLLHFSKNYFLSLQFYFIFDKMMDSFSFKLAFSTHNTFAKMERYGTFYKYLVYLNTFEVYFLFYKLYYLGLMKLNLTLTIKVNAKS